MNEKEMAAVADYMSRIHPDRAYTMLPGADCIRVSLLRASIYFFFKDGKIVDTMVD
jgi:hypothetical protein